MISADKIKPAAFPVLSALMSDRQVSWSVGTFGALAEFFHLSRGRLEITEEPDALTARNTMGAIRIVDHPALRLLPYEGLSKLANAWTQGLLVCLPHTQAALSGRRGLYHLGADRDALAGDQAGHDLFDLGLGVGHLDACIRTGDPALLALLHRYEGHDLFGPDRTLQNAITDASPARVFVSKIARIEVYGPIPDAEGTTPLGPHTHLSEKLLSRNRTQAATLPVPDGWVPVLAAYPPNPLRAIDGSIKPFDADAHARFQALFHVHADPRLVRIKQAFTRAMAENLAPEEFDQPLDKAERTALRVAIRQHHHQHGPTEALTAWRRRFEPG